MASILLHSSSPFVARSAASCCLPCCASFLTSSRASWIAAMLLLAGASTPALTPDAAASLTAPCERAIHSSMVARRLLTSTSGGCSCGRSCAAQPHMTIPAVRQAPTTLHRDRLLRCAVSIFFLPARYQSTQAQQFGTA